MARPKARADAGRPRLTPRVKVWVEAEDGFSFGSGLIEILQAVGRAGSIKAAADELGRSYRHIWDRIKRAEAALGRTLIAARVGGQGAHRSALTDDGRQLIDDFLALRARMIAAMEHESARWSR